MPKRRQPRLIGGRSGFRTGRDLALFLVGLFVVAFHLLTTSVADLRLEVLLFGAGLMGAPYVINRDERKE